jgi:hypothetical protein
MEQFVNPRVDDHVSVFLASFDRLFDLGQAAAKLFQFRLLQALAGIEGLFDQRPEFVAKRLSVSRLPVGFEILALVFDQEVDCALILRFVLLLRGIDRRLRRILSSGTMGRKGATDGQSDRENEGCSLHG